MFGLKKLNKQLQNLGVQELVAGADLWTAKGASPRHLLASLWAYWQTQGMYGAVTATDGVSPNQLLSFPSDNT